MSKRNKIGNLISEESCLDLVPGEMLQRWAKRKKEILEESEIKNMWNCIPCYPRLCRCSNRRMVHRSAPDNSLIK